MLRLEGHDAACNAARSTTHAYAVLGVSCRSLGPRVSTCKLTRCRVACLKSRGCCVCCQFLVTDESESGLRYEEAPRLYCIEEVEGGLKRLAAVVCCDVVWLFPADV